MIKTFEMSSIAGPVRTKLYDNICHFFSHIPNGGCIMIASYSIKTLFWGDNSFIWTSNIPGLNLWYSVIKWPNNLLFKSKHLRMKGSFANIYIRTAINNWGYTSQSSFLVTPVRAGQTITRNVLWGKEKYFFVYTRIDCLALWNWEFYSPV